MVRLHMIVCVVAMVCFFCCFVAGMVFLVVDQESNYRFLALGVPPSVVVAFVAAVRHERAREAEEKRE